jgi:hypothetical protein
MVLLRFYNLKGIFALWTHFFWIDAFIRLLIIILWITLDIIIFILTYRFFNSINFLFLLLFLMTWWILRWYFNIVRYKFYFKQKYHFNCNQNLLVHLFIRFFMRNSSQMPSNFAFNLINCQIRVILHSKVTIYKLFWSYQLNFADIFLLFPDLILKFKLIINVLNYIHFILILKYLYSDFDFTISFILNYQK